LEPVIVKLLPTEPDAAERLLIAGGDATVKKQGELVTPLMVTSTLPDVAPLGTGTTMLVSLQLLGVPATPLNVTVLLPWELPKPLPLIVTDVPTAPEVGDRLVIEGVGAEVTVKTPGSNEGLPRPPGIARTMSPVVAPLGTGTTMLVSLQLLGVPVVLLKVTVLLP
jgi:hypothetical protein